MAGKRAQTMKMTVVLVSLFLSLVLTYIVLPYTLTSQWRASRVFTFTQYFDASLFLPDNNSTQQQQQQQRQQQQQYQQQQQRQQLNNDKSAISFKTELTYSKKETKDSPKILPINPSTVQQIQKLNPTFSKSIFASELQPSSHPGISTKINNAESPSIKTKTTEKDKNLTSQSNVLGKSIATSISPSFSQSPTSKDSKPAHSLATASKSEQNIQPSDKTYSSSAEGDKTIISSTKSSAKNDDVIAHSISSENTANANGNSTPNKIIPASMITENTKLSLKSSLPLTNSTNLPIESSKTDNKSPTSETKNKENTNLTSKPPPPTNSTKLSTSSSKPDNKSPTPETKTKTSPPPAPPTTTKKPEIDYTKQACHFPNQDPFDPDVMKHFRKHPEINCDFQTVPGVVYLDGNFLRVNKTKAELKDVTLDYCYYEIVKRYYSEYSVFHTKSKGFTEAIEIDPKSENMVVTCLFGNKTVARSYISVLRKKNATEESCKTNYKRHIETNSPKETLSVLMIGIDGTSRQNFIRSMPDTRKFIVDKLGAIELMKFNKIGDNTFPNVVPLLSGLSRKELFQIWSTKESLNKVDDKFIWHHYQKAGYRTGMILDHLYITAFHYLKKGWNDPPFDYYFRTMVVDLYKRQEKIYKNKQHCVGDIPEVTYLLDYYVQLCTTFNNSRTTPYFAYSFIVKLTHDNPNWATMADRLYLEFFQELTRRNVLNNTLIIWFSDHGARFGPIRSTQAGVMESKTPFMFFIFPEWFRTKYADVMNTLHTNQHRLTTHYDVHATLQDLLNFKGIAGEKGNLSSRGISLFKEIPLERTCQHAQVPIEFCMCSELENKTIPLDVKMKVTDTLLEHIVNKTTDKRDLCDVMKLQSVKSVIYTRSDSIKCEDCSFFLATVEVTPGLGVFEATVEYDFKTGAGSVQGQVIRLNMYKGQAECVDDSGLRPFCYCKNLLY